MEQQMNLYEYLFLYIYIYIYICLNRKSLNLIQSLLEFFFFHVPYGCYDHFK